MSVEKRCDCDVSRWTRCAHPWYMQTFRWQGQAYEPNLTRYARVVLQREIGTKTEADTIDGLVQSAIRAGTYIAAKDYQSPAPATPAPVVPAGLTLRAIGAAFLTTVVQADPTKRPNSKANDAAIVARLCRTLGDRPMAAITIDDLIAFRNAHADFAASTWAKYRTCLGQLWAWARWAGHLDADLFTTTPPARLKLLARQKAAKRSRRVSDEELANVLEAAREARTGGVANRLHAILVAAIETGCRVGELLALQWRDVQLDRRQWFVRAEEVGGAKTGTGRMIDLTQPLIDVLETIQHDPAGQPFPRSAYVFGTPYGDRVQSIDKAWRTAVLRAHGIEPVWTDQGDFDAASRAALQRIDLHIHDLRHEAGCRLLESGCFDLAQIQRRYGHASLAQTADYLHATASSVRQAVAAYDAQRGVVRTHAGPSADKLRTNARSTPSAARTPRLVKSNKTNVIK